MTKHLLSELTLTAVAVATLTLLNAPAHASLIFLDPYDTDAHTQDINAGIGARTSGSVTVTSYNEAGSDWQTQLRNSDGDILLLAPRNSPGQPRVWAGPDHDFSADLGSQYSISFDVNPSTYPTAWAGFTFGVNAANQGAEVTDNHGGLSLRLWGGDDSWEIFDGTDGLATAVQSGNQTATDYRTVLLAVTDSGSDVTVDLSIDGVSQTSYTYTGSFAGNYMAFSAYTDNSDNHSGVNFDNLTVVPEPSTVVLAALGLLGLRRRRRS